MQPTLFKTVPEQEYFPSIEEDPQQIVDFLKFSKLELAKATGVPKSSIRYDNRMPKELAQYLLEYKIVCELVANYFHGDLKKTNLWFCLKNPALGNISPADMIKIGRYKKLMAFVQNALEGNTP